jgi:hypothetical protein
MSFGVMEISIRISKEHLGSQVVCAELESLQAFPDTVMYEVVRVKLKLHCRN